MLDDKPTPRRRHADRRPPASNPRVVPAGSLPGRTATVVPASIPFLVLDENRFALTALRNLERRRPPAVPATTSLEAFRTARSGARLLYVYGPSGNGKSLLAKQFVRNEQRENTRVRVEHVTAAEFAADLAEASRENTIPSFQRRFRELDVLVCEDLQSLEGRWETQRQLIFAVDEVLATGGRCLLTCRKSPGELVNVMRRLVDRCRGGVSAAVKLPKEEARASLLMHFAQSRQIPISRDAVVSLSRELPVSPRELLATVVQLDALSRLNGSTIDDRFVRRYLAGEVKPAAITLEHISRAVAKHFGISQRQLRSGGRAQGEVLPRQCAMWLCRKLTRTSLQNIARFFGRQNHATAVHACERLDALMQTDAATRRHVAEIRHKITIRATGG
jgi:chromosomal replication initiator protein